MPARSGGSVRTAVCERPPRSRNQIPIKKSPWAGPAQSAAGGQASRSAHPGRGLPRGRCLKGHRLNGKAPFGNWKIQTFIAGLRQRGLTAPFVIDQPMNRRIFKVWVRPSSLQPWPKAMSSFSTICPPIKARPPKMPLGPKGHCSRIPRTDCDPRSAGHREALEQFRVAPSHGF